MTASVAENRSLVPSFVDLREWIAKIDFPEESEGEAFLSHRTLLPLPDGPISVGAILFPDTGGEVAAMPAEEFLIVAAGTLRLDQAGHAVALEQGDSLVLPKGAAFKWTATADTHVLFMRKTGGPAGDTALVPIDPTSPLEPSGAPLAELLVGPTPQCRNHSAFRSEDGEFVCGTWDSTPYHRKTMLYRHYELMYLLEGSVSFEDGAGTQRTFATGDIFLVEQGAHCSWDSQDHVKKVYAIYRPV
jgi:uncharacterized cupin superfamily protein